MHPTPRSIIASALLLLATGCGTSASNGTTPRADAAVDAVEAAVEDTGSEAPADVGVDSGPAAPFPAFTPVNPVVNDFGGPTLIAPRIVPVFMSGGDAGTYPFEAQLRTFLGAYLASPEWLTQVGEYGVHAGTVAPSLHSTGAGLGTSAIDSAQIHAWAQAQLRAGAFGTTSAGDLVVLFLDGSRQGAVGPTQTLCHTIGGYHESITDATGRGVALAVIPDCYDNLEIITNALSHEMVEAVTDAFPNRFPAFYQPGTMDAPDGAWAMAYDGGEVADLCEQRSDASYLVTSLGHTIQRTWSNMAAAANTDPCVPVPPGSVYFNSAPVLPEIVQLTGPDGVHTVGARGITIANGASAMVPVQLFSTGPTSGPWQVTAREVPRAGTATALRFTWNHTTGRNGDTLQLSIAVRARIPEGRVFIVRSTLGGQSTTWVGAVVSP